MNLKGLLTGIAERADTKDGLRAKYEKKLVELEQRWRRRYKDDELKVQQALDDAATAISRVSRIRFDKIPGGMAVQVAIPAQELYHPHDSEMYIRHVSEQVGHYVRRELSQLNAATIGRQIYEAERRAQDARPYYPRFALVALLSCLLASAAFAEPQPLRCTVNWANQEGQQLLDRQTGWEGTLITDAACESSTARPDMRACWAEFVAKAGPARYISYRLNDPGDPRYPLPILPVNPLTAKETLEYKGRTYPDLRRMDVRAKFVAAMVEELTKQPPSPILHDNLVHPGAGGTTAGVYNWPFSWEVSCNYLRELRDALPRGYLLIANVAGYAFYWPQEEIDLLSQSVHGVAFEMPIHLQCRTDPVKMRAQIAAYRTWLQAGLVVVFMDVNKAATNRTQENFYNAAMAYMIREPGQSLFMHWSAGLDPDKEAKAAGFEIHWQHWPLLLGKPVGPLVVNDDGSVTREFALGTLTASAPHNVVVKWK